MDTEAVLKLKLKPKPNGIGDFERFWNSYPRKTNKQAAIVAFQKIDVSLIDVMLGRLDEQKKSVQWQEARFIPHASTWLNGRRWEDETVKAPPKPGSQEYYLTH